MIVSDGRFTKADRLVKTADFARVYRSGRSFPGGAFVVKVLPNNSAASRIGFSISARSIKSAVKRNRIRRLFREAFRKNKRALKTGFDIVIVVRKEAHPKFSYTDAEKIYLESAKKANLSI